MRKIEELIEEIQDSIEYLEFEIQDLWDDYIKVSRERDELEEKIRKLES
uniref:SNARE Vesicle transport v-SNARE protein N-terminus n=1 Tax=Siphoviridae sp. ct1SN28 TaxID=2825308 RepID=A0A8S5TRN6_9CAUD|nr:MAG TPA: SNARE Vesicle transport v-SNARE protein N-terminus [Siphoviridae sp. ct1SN28]